MESKLAMDPEVRAIADEMLVVVDGEKWKAVHMSIDRLEDGIKWVHLQIEKDGRKQTYLLDQKYMVNAWLKLVAGKIDIDKLNSIVDGARWTPIDTSEVYINDVRCVRLVLRSPENVVRTISIDHENLVKAYYALRTNITDIGDDIRTFLGI